ncbi:glycine oxidase ThiO [Magnetococcales bacterium HHB-1]
MEHVIIIGAGVMGCACAHRLLNAGFKVTLLEKSLPGAESSAAAAGILGAQSEVSDAGPFFELCLASRERFEGYAEELEEISQVSVGYRKAGVLEVALDPAEGRIAIGRAEWMMERGLRVEVLDREEAQKEEPYLSVHVIGANFYPDDHQVNSEWLARALAATASKLGAIFHNGRRVTGIQSHQGRVTGVKTETGVLEADHVVIAGGAWSTRIHGLPPLRTRVKPMAGQILQWETRPPLLSRIVYGYSGYIVPRADGIVITGSTLDDRGFDKTVTAGGIHKITQMAMRMTPELTRAHFRQCWAGLRPAPEDGLPLLGESQIKGLHFATGHYRNGILLTPITAEVICDSIMGKTPAVDITAFKP